MRAQVPEKMGHNWPHLAQPGFRGDCLDYRSVLYIKYTKSGNEAGR